jgi:hypothetical protein
VIDPAALAATHWNTRSALHIARGAPSLGRWDDRSPATKAYLTEAMRLTLEAHGLLPKEPKQEPLEGQLPLFGE